MFDAVYKFNYQGYTKTPTQPYTKLHKFSFKCRFNHKYIIRVEKYEHQVFVIKFYLKNHEQSEKKYQLLSGLNDASRVIATSIAAMIWLYKKDNLSSFGFIGANSEGEEIGSTKRFKLYVKLMESFFSSVLFNHKEYEENSAYLLLNKEKSKEYDDLEQIIKELFIKYYDMSL
ncbi:MAG: hypothetical protein COZ18_16715 [Flexibacter sp. CG_4_10_14_3_um_filter_32_15]|nr:MAG: hypothetical protein COZ18_16715 [Flexibacter sp. CG_4_10_14_3_um_filter_32_15]